MPRQFDAQAILAGEADPLAGLRRFLESGGSTYQAATITGIAATTLRRWLRDGMPEPARDLCRILVAFRPDGRIAQGS